MRRFVKPSLVFSICFAAAAHASGEDPAAVVAALDTQYQAAVKANDAAGMANILADDFTLVTGKGKTFGKSDLLAEAHKKHTIYERQEEMPDTQKVRVYGDTAVVTALLWVKGHDEAHAFDYKLWFSDVYVRSKGHWHYVFGQAAQPLNPENK